MNRNLLKIDCYEFQKEEVEDRVKEEKNLERRTNCQKIG